MMFPGIISKQSLTVLPLFIQKVGSLLINLIKARNNKTIITLSLIYFLNYMGAEGNRNCVPFVSETSNPNDKNAVCTVHFAPTFIALVGHFLVYVYLLKNRFCWFCTL